ncbi:MAG: hypothetical protein CBC46_04745 [Verrucomicrobiaceae bacterium TMED86]|nr:MAG: hypothetical protein CBC46_04745 [Verrucomicrobiaceae bacterium TMED86]
MFLNANNSDQLTPYRGVLLSLIALIFSLSGVIYSQTIPLEPFSPSSDVPLSNALESTRSGTLASSAPNPGGVYSLEVIAGQAMLFDFEASGLGRYRARVEDPEGVILQERSFGDGESDRVSLIAGKSGRYFVRLQPLTIEEVVFDFSANLNLILDEAGNESIPNAQLIDQGLMPTGFHDRSITLRSESEESIEVFQIDLGAGESLSLAAEAQQLDIKLRNNLGELLAASSSGVNGLTALIDGFSVTANQSLFVEILNPRMRDYDFVATISSPEDELTPPSVGRLIVDESRPFSNIQKVSLVGELLNAGGFARDSYQMTFERNQAVSLIMSKSGSGPVSYLLESPGRDPLRVGAVGQETGLSFTAVESGDYFLTIATTDGALAPYQVELSTNVLMEPSVKNDSEATAYPIAYGWTKIGGCSRLLTVSGQVGLGSDRFDLEPNNTLEEAQDLDVAEWSLEASSDILDSTILPHTSMRGGGDGSKDLYRVKSRVPNSRLICDIDRSFSLDSFVRVLDGEGNLIAENDDSEISDGARGSGSQNDSFIDVELGNPGTYFIEVGRGGGDGTLRNNDRYELHVSLAHHQLQVVPESDQHDYYRVDLAEGELFTLACYQDDPLIEVFENGNPLSVGFYSRFDLPQILTYRADSDTSLIVKLSNELIVPYDLLMILNAGLEDPFHAVPAAAMSVSAGESTLGWVSDDLPDFYRIIFSDEDVRTVSILQSGQPIPLNIEVYNLSQELVMSSESSVTIPGELGNEFYIAVTRKAHLPAFYLLRIGDAATDCREVFPTGSFSIEWQVIPDQVYQVEFSSNLLDWTLIPEVISSPNSTLQWVDAGPPRTDSAPGIEHANRYYRLVVPEE